MNIPLKLQGREMVNVHAVAKKVNEVIDLLLSAEEDEKQLTPEFQESQDVDSMNENQEAQKDA